MKAILFLVPVIASIFAILIYRFQDGKRQIFSLDLVQFVYLFIVSPTMFVWAKSLIFYMLKSEIDLKLNITELFVIDTLFTLLSFFIFIAVTIHSLTKTFKIKRYRDPKFDLYHLSEYFHLWWSHIVIWSGAMAMATFISMINLFIPLDFESSKSVFYSVFTLGLFLGIIAFLSVWMSDPEQGNFMRLMKILFGFFFLIHVVLYFLVDPSFSVNFGLYWVVSAMFFSAVVCSATFERYEKTNKFRKMMLHVGWGDNIKLFKSKK